TSTAAVCLPILSASSFDSTKMSIRCPFISPPVSSAEAVKVVPSSRVTFTVLPRGITLGSTAIIRFPSSVYIVSFTFNPFAVVPVRPVSQLAVYNLASTSISFASLLVVILSSLLVLLLVTSLLLSESFTLSSSSTLVSLSSRTGLALLGGLLRISLFTSFLLFFSLFCFDSLSFSSFFIRSISSSNSSISSSLSSNSFVISSFLLRSLTKY